MAYSHCRDCRRGVVTAEQVERWPHLARHTVGVLDDKGRCEPCAYTAARKAAQTRATNLRKRQGRSYVVDDLNRVLETEDVLADWEVLRDADVPLDEAAARLRLSVQQLRTVLGHARLSGDERGWLEPYARDAPRPPRMSLRLRQPLVPA